MPPGLSDTGFEKRTIEDLLLQLESEEVANISSVTDVSSSSPLGQLNGSFVKIAAEIWDQLQAIYVAGDPDRNTGDGQDAVCAITGTTREAATHSQAEGVQVSLNIGTVLTVGSLVAVLGNPTAQFRFRGVEPAPGDPVVEANFTSPATGNYFVRFEAVDTGVVVANAGTLTVIVTPISGWTAVTNATDAVLGHDIESPSALRLRREQELASPGSTTVDAMQAALTQFMADEGLVPSVSVFENTGDSVDGDGRPPHSLEVLINDGGALTDDDIAQEIWGDKGGGIQMFGATTGTAHDSAGNSRTVPFNRPTLVPIYFAITVVTNPDLFPVDGDVQIEEAVVAYGQASRDPGDDVIQNSFYGPIWGIVGVTSVTVLNLGTAPAPGSSADITIAVRSLATFDTSRVAVTVT